MVNRTAVCFGLLLCISICAGQLLISGHQTPAYVGLSRIITCTWTGLEDLINLDWYIVGLEGLGLGVKVGFSDTILNVGRIRDISWNGGQFVCKATTEGGILVQRKISLWIKELDHTVDITASENMPKAGEKLTLTCTVRSKVPAMVKWVTENGDPVLNTSNVIVSPQRMFCLIHTVNISFDPLKMSHVGIYTCISSNRQSRIKDKYLVTITGELQISGHETPVYVGFSRSITCTWTGIENITKLDWYIVGLEGLGLGMKLYDRTTSLNTGRIADVSWNGRKYMCKATLVGGKTVQKNIALWVKELENEIMITPPCEETFMAGDCHTLTCTVNSELPANLKWIRIVNGQQFEVVNTSTITVSMQNVLGMITKGSITFKPLNASHAGMYKCVSVLSNRGPKLLSIKELECAVKVKIVPGNGSTQDTLPSVCPAPVLPSSLEVFFVGNTPQVNGTTLMFIANTSQPANVSSVLRLAGGTFKSLPGKSTIFKGLTPGETYILRLMATTCSDRAISRVSFTIPAHFGSCYVHFTNKGLELMGSGEVLVNFGSVGPVTEYTCSLNRRLPQKCTSPYSKSGLSRGRYKLHINPVGTFCTDAKQLSVIFDTL